MEGEAMEEAEEEVAEDEVEAKWASYSAGGRRRMLGGIIMMLGLLGGGVSCPGAAAAIPSPLLPGDGWT